MLANYMRSTLLSLGVIIFFASPAMAGITAGTGKANIDPAPSLLPVHNNPGDPELATIHDSLFARALVLENGRTTVIMVAADIIDLPDDVYDRMVARIADAYHVPKDHIWLTATHCHTVPWSMGGGFEQTVSDGVMAAIAEAATHQEPVTIGSGTGKAYININRDEKTPSGFILGQDPDGPSDKTVRVAAFFRGDGTPLAILSNYAVHAVTLHSSFTAGDKGVISADIPGAANAFLDARYPNSLSLWTSGAAADQNPVMMSIYAEPRADGSAKVNDLKDAGLAVPQRLGQNLALEIARVTSSIKPRPAFTLSAAQIVITCPSKADPKLTKPLRISYLDIGGIDLVAVSGEVDTLIDSHLRRANPKRAPILLTLTNGYGGYLPDDGSYKRGQTFEVQKTFFAPGCVDRAIVKAATRLMTRRH